MALLTDADILVEVASTTRMRPPATAERLSPQTIQTAAQEVAGILVSAASTACCVPPSAQSPCGDVPDSVEFSVVSDAPLGAQDIHTIRTNVAQLVQDGAP